MDTPTSSDPIKDALQTLPDITLVTNHLTVVEYLDPEGNPSWQLIPGKGQRTSTIFRLADLAYRIADHWMTDMVDECIDGS